MTRLGYIDTNDALEAHLYIKAQDLVSYIRAWKVQGNRNPHYTYHNEEKCIMRTLDELKRAYSLGAATSPAKTVALDHQVTAAIDYVDSVSEPGDETPHSPEDTTS
jgi:hypothetical protein